MKKLLILLLFVSFGYAENFQFNPETDNLNKLEHFCWQSVKKGANFGESDNDKVLCDELVSKSVKYYDQKCDVKDVNSCVKLAVIYYEGLGQIKKDEDKSMEIHKKACELKEPSSCLALGLRYANKYHGYGKYGKSDDKNKKKEFKNKAIKYYKEACELGAQLGCNGLKDF